MSRIEKVWIEEECRREDSGGLEQGEKHVSYSGQIAFIMPAVPESDVIKQMMATKLHFVMEWVQSSSFLYGPDISPALLGFRDQEASEIFGVFIYFSEALVDPTPPNSCIPRIARFLG